MIRRLIAPSHGEPQDVLRLATLPDDPPPGPGEVKVAVHAVGRVPIRLDDTAGGAYCGSTVRCTVVVVAVGGGMITVGCETVVVRVVLVS